MLVATHRGRKEKKKKKGVKKWWHGMRDLASKLASELDEMDTLLGRDQNVHLRLSLGPEQLEGAPTRL